MKLFVPGRICLFGEHTDWAGGYRRINGKLGKGYALIAGTNQGLYAEVRPHPNKLIFRATLNDGTRECFELPMERDALMEEAQKGGFFSYAAGVAYQLLTHYRVRGLEIDNYKTDLPVRKGLSSSAAVCVLVARAFNRVYDLKMTVRGEMEFAYLGEITTPSRCGRLDQGCAYGNRPVMLTFDGDQLDVHELHVPENLYYVLVDLKAKKDTVHILAELNRCYPFAENELQRGVQHYLGEVSAEITHRAAAALQQGDAAALGIQMKDAQQGFDEFCGPACPHELTAPVLHKVLSYEPIQSYIFGGKGVGSQGDGTAQFLAKDSESREKLIEILERDLGVECMRLDLQSGQRVRKAVVPAAGFGTRLFPATKAVKKELFPVVGPDGRCKPVILWIVEEIIKAGIEEVAIIVQPEDKAMFEEFFALPPRAEHFSKLKKEDRDYAKVLQEIGRRVTVLTQDTQDGFGHAIYCANEWVGKEPFLLMLGDHLYASSEERSCTRQLLDVYEQVGRSVVGLKTEPVDVIGSFGCVTGEWEDDQVLDITEFAEKPAADYAREFLQTDKIPDDHFLTVFGQYVLTPKVFDYLSENIEMNLREGGEFQLTSCLDKVRREEGFCGYVMNGRRFDIGQPEVYRQTVMEFRNT